MSEVTISGRTLTIERFSLAKSMRVLTLLRVMQKQAPEVFKHYTDWRRAYAKDNALELDRTQALAEFPWLRERLTDEDWEREGQVYRVPVAPRTDETFFEMAPIVYEKAEEVTLRLLGLIAMDEATVSRYVKTGDIWERVDELVDDLIRPAGLDEVLELVLAAAEIIDGQVLAKIDELRDRAGKAKRRLGIGTATNPATPPVSTTSNEQPEPQSSDSFTDSRSDTTGPQIPSEPSLGMTSSGSPTGSPVTA